MSPIEDECQHREILRSRRCDSKCANAIVSRGRARDDDSVRVRARGTRGVRHLGLESWWHRVRDRRAARHRDPMGRMDRAARSRRLADPMRFAVESLVWIGAIAVLVDLDRLELAIAFGVLAFVTAAAARRYEPQVTAREPNPDSH